MNENQFKEFMEGITSLMRNFQQNTGNNPANVNNNIPAFENFNPKEEKFKNYLERFNNYLAVRNINDDKKKAQLLTVSIGSTHYNNLSALLGPEKPIQDLTFKLLSESFGKMLSPERNVVVSQHYFLNTYQTSNQSISEFVASLQKDLPECKFKATCTCNLEVSVADIFLRAQFIRGLRDNWIREQLLQLDVTTFADILKKATALEASRIETQALTKIDNLNATSSNVSEIHKVRASRNRHRSNSRHKQRPKSKIDYSSLGIDGLCFKCGRNNHRASDCRIKHNNLKCSLCNKSGHIAKVCITSMVKEQQSITKSKEPAKNYQTNIVTFLFNKCQFIPVIVKIFLLPFS